MRVGDGDAVAGPVDQLDVVLTVAERDRALAGKAEMLGEEFETGGFRHVG